MPTEVLEMPTHVEHVQVFFILHCAILTSCMSFVKSANTAEHCKCYHDAEFLEAEETN